MSFDGFTVKNNSDAFEGKFDARQSTRIVDMLFPYRYLIYNYDGVENGIRQSTITIVYAKEGFYEDRTLTPVAFTRATVFWFFYYTSPAEDTGYWYATYIGSSILDESTVYKNLLLQETVPIPSEWGGYDYVIGSVVTASWDGRRRFQLYDSGIVETPAKPTDPTADPFSWVWDTQNRELNSFRVVGAGEHPIPRRVSGGFQIIKSYSLLSDIGVGDLSPIGLSWAPPSSAITTNPGYQPKDNIYVNSSGGTVSGNYFAPQLGASSPYYWLSRGSYYSPTYYDSSKLPVQFTP